MTQATQDRVKALRKWLAQSALSARDEQIGHIVILGYN